MCSAVSQRALGECNAVRCRRIGHSELTFVGVLEPISAARFCTNSRWPTIRPKSEFFRIASECENHLQKHFGCVT